MVDKQFIPSSPSPEPWREIQDGVIALHDALKSAGDFDGRELIECVLLRLERAAAMGDPQARAQSDGAANAESGEERGAQ